MLNWNFQCDRKPTYTGNEMNGFTGFSKTDLSSAVWILWGTPPSQECKDLLSSGIHRHLHSAQVCLFGNCLCMRVFACLVPTEATHGGIGSSGTGGMDGGGPHVNAKN